MVVSEKNHIYFHTEKLARVGLKVFRLLRKKTKGPAEAYAVLLILKSCFEGEFGLKENEFQPLIEAFARASGIPSLVCNFLELYRYLIENFLINYCRNLIAGFVCTTNTSKG